MVLKIAFLGGGAVQMEYIARLGMHGTRFERG
jgi:hypothetical protein